MKIKETWQDAMGKAMRRAGEDWSDFEHCNGDLSDVVPDETDKQFLLWTTWEEVRA